MYKGVDADYYGYRDDDDGTLKPLERLEEEQGAPNQTTLTENPDGKP